MKIISLPKEVSYLLTQLEAPQRLVKHLTLVHATAFYIVSEFKNTWTNLPINEEEILFGAATHDIGKVIFTEELYEKGSKHEVAGFELLKQHGFSDAKARFAKTHGNWQAPNLTLDDLLVCLADKVWKGKRVPELEEHITNIIAQKTTTDYWEVFVKLEAILEEIVIGSDERIAWQGI